jgi:hypothetical protein
MAARARRWGFGRGGLDRGGSRPADARAWGGRWAPLPAPRRELGEGGALDPWLSPTSPRWIHPRFDRLPPPDRAQSRPAGLASELHLARKGREETDGELDEVAPARVASSAFARPAGWSSAPPGREEAAAPLSSPPVAWLQRRRRVRRRERVRGRGRGRVIKKSGTRSNWLV